MIAAILRYPGRFCHILLFGLVLLLQIVEEMLCDLLERAITWHANWSQKWPSDASIADSTARDYYDEFDLEEWEDENP